MYFDIIKLDPVNNYYLYDLYQLIDIKKTMHPEILKQYVMDMECLFDLPLETVVTKSKSISKNKKDYVSLATYYWPNPDAENGLPYIQKDGYANPDGHNYDKDKLRRLSYLVYHASILRYLTNDVRYQKLLEKHIEHFFLNEKTGMNPNLNYGQFIPGHSIGRKEGIIDYTANFTYALRMLINLESLRMVNKDLMNSLRDWHTSFLEWMLQSNIGKDEQNAMNNHGTFYDLACVIMMKFTDQDHLLDNFESSFLNRVDYQIIDDGSMPLELKRTKSLSYTLMNIKGFIELKKELSVPNQPKLDLAVNWIKDHVFDTKWPYTQVTQVDPGISLLHQQMYKNEMDILVTSLVNQNEVINKTLWYLHKI